MTPTIMGERGFRNLVAIEALVGTEYIPVKTSLRSAGKANGD